MILPSQPFPSQQNNLIHFVHEDDRIPQDSENAEWLRILNELEWKEFKTVAARYYDALYLFNINEA